MIWHENHWIHWKLEISHLPNSAHSAAARSSTQRRPRFRRPALGRPRPVPRAAAARRGARSPTYHEGWRHQSHRPEPGRGMGPGERSWWLLIFSYFCPLTFIRFNMVGGLSMKYHINLSTGQNCWLSIRMKFPGRNQQQVHPAGVLKGWALGHSSAPTPPSPLPRGQGIFVNNGTSRSKMENGWNWDHQMSTRSLSESDLIWSFEPFWVLKTHIDKSARSPPTFRMGPQECSRHLK